MTSERLFLQLYTFGFVLVLLE